VQLQRHYRAAGSLKGTNGVAKVHILAPAETMSPPYFAMCSRQVNTRPAMLSTELNADTACQLCLTAYLRNVNASPD
jgi:hypothetical protein